MKQQDSRRLVDGSRTTIQDSRLVFRKVPSKIVWRGADKATHPPVKFEGKGDTTLVMTTPQLVPIFFKPEAVLPIFVYLQRSDERYHV